MDRRLLVIQALAFGLLVSCSVPVSDADGAVFADDVVLKTTPVKNDPSGRLSWMYAMLSTIETDRLMAGDSVHLSVAYPIRRWLDDAATGIFLRRDDGLPPLDGTAFRAIRLLERYGAAPYDACPDRSDTDAGALLRGIREIAAYAPSIAAVRQRTADFLDRRMGALPYAVYMYGARYSFHEFARSVCFDRYRAVTSFAHHPFGERFVLEVSANRCGDTFLNVPVDSMVSLVEQAIRHGRAVCWEGDASEPGFSFARGVAVLPSGFPVGQQARQREFERRRTTDDHCLSLMGMARDRRGRRYFIAKDSQGTGNPYGGFMYVSYDYIRMKTIAVYLYDETCDI